jgi:hypothetical protein
VIQIVGQLGSFHTTLHETSNKIVIKVVVGHMVFDLIRERRSLVEVKSRASVFHPR